MPHASNRPLVRPRADHDLPVHPFVEPPLPRHQSPPSIGSRHCPKTHVSLAYRFDRPFTLDEVGLAYRAIAHVKKIDLRLAEPACYDCRSPLVYDWSEVPLEEEDAQGHGGDR